MKVVKLNLTKATFFFLDRYCMCADNAMVMSLSLGRTTSFFALQKQVVASWIYYLLWIKNQDYEYQIEWVNIVLSVQHPAVTWRPWVQASQIFSFGIDNAVCSLQFKFEARPPLSLQFQVCSITTSPIALHCSTSLYQESPTIPCILLVHVPTI